MSGWPWWMAALVALGALTACVLLADWLRQLIEQAVYGDQGDRRTNVKLIKLWKTRESTTNVSCPALYRTDDGARHVVQGTKIDADTRARLQNVGADKDAVYVPADVLDRLRAVDPAIEYAVPPTVPAQ